MKLHQRLGTMYASFSSLALVLNVFAPDNPGQLFNIIEMGVLSIAFLCSIFSSRKVGGLIQIIALIVSAFIPMTFSDSPFFGAVVAIFAVISIYAYGGYQTFQGFKFALTFVALFTLSLIASLAYMPSDGPGVLVRAFGWTVFIFLFLSALWFILDDINRRFYTEKEKKLIELNRELLEMNKKLVHGGCEDGPI